MATFAGFDHVDLRVNDLAEARPLYDALLPELGLTDIHESDGTLEYYEAAARATARRFFGLNVDSAHRPGASRVAFAAATPGEVDRLAEIVVRAGGRMIEGPEIPYSTEQYYAVFFEDASGNKLEICYRRSHNDSAGAVSTATSEELAQAEPARFEGG